MGLFITSSLLIKGFKCFENGQLIFYHENIVTFADFIKTLYKKEQINYPKFYKMDNLSKLGFIASDIVLRSVNIKDYRPDEVGVILSNASSSLDTDISHNETIKDRGNYFPSPSVFVYTLPNIVIGEICIRNKFRGENAFFVTESFNEKLVCDYVTDLFLTAGLRCCLCGWIEVLGNKFEALMVVVESIEEPVNEEVSSSQLRPFNTEMLKFIKEPNH